jgi:hypothetical protein
MKRNISSELISVVTIGALWGLFTNRTHEKWHRLGREAFLAWESQYFDRHLAVPDSAINVCLIWVLTAIIVFTFYKVLVYFLAKILTAFSNNKDAIQS